MFKVFAFCFRIVNSARPRARPGGAGPGRRRTLTAPGFPTIMQVFFRFLHPAAVAAFSGFLPGMVRSGEFLHVPFGFCIFMSPFPAPFSPLPFHQNSLPISSIFINIPVLVAVDEPIFSRYNVVKFPFWHSFPPLRALRIYIQKIRFRERRHSL